MFETEFAFCISTCIFRLLWLCIRWIALSHSSLKHKAIMINITNNKLNIIQYYKTSLLLILMEEM